ncbi:MAG TPA: hypothetical protein VG013_10055 [Gemmataceae bacterium]|jgi:hypothetical protein|nr:hypothetical protein [Gemmataceae bacterium]
MSWDVSVLAAKIVPPPVAEMADDWRGDILGSADEVRVRISACLPAVDWSNPTWGIYVGDGFSYEFNVGRKDPSDGFMVHVRGAGDPVAPLIQMAERCGWYLLDHSQGEWLHHCAKAGAGWQGFQAYRDRMLGRSGSQPGEPA